MKENITDTSLKIDPLPLIEAGQRWKIFYNPDNLNNRTQIICAIVDGDQLVTKDWSEIKQRYYYEVKHIAFLYNLIACGEATLENPDEQRTDCCSGDSLLEMDLNRQELINYLNKFAGSDMGEKTYRGKPNDNRWYEALAGSATLLSGDSVVIVELRAENQKLRDHLQTLELYGDQV